MQNCWLWVWIGLLGVLQAHAEEIPGPRYQSVRSVALGDICVGLAEDAAFGLFYHPAELSRIRRSGGELLNLAVQGSEGIAALRAHNVLPLPHLNTLTPHLLKHPGKKAGLGATFLPTLFLPGVALGVLVESHGLAQANADGSISYRSRYQWVPALGFGFRFAQGWIRMGYVVHWVQQAQGAETVEATQALSFMNSLVQGSAFDHHLGLSLSLPLRSFPQLDWVLRHVGDTIYQSQTLLPFSKQSLGVPNRERMTLEGALSFHPHLGRGVILHAMMQVRDVLNRFQTSWIDRMSLGAELAFRKRIFLRTGWRANGISAGIGFQREGAELSFARYQEKILLGSSLQEKIAYAFQYRVQL